MHDSRQSLSALRERLVADWALGGTSKREVFASGDAFLDTYLEGGFQRGQLHEIFADHSEDNGSAAGFAAMLALRAMQPGKSILWLRTLGAMHKGGRFHPAGFAELGGDPAAICMAVAPDETALLRCATDALRCDGFTVVIIECWGEPATFDLTASRRLTLAADRSGVTALMLRHEASEQPSTASTRWSVRSALSKPLAANAPGHPALELTLLRRRSGPSGKSWRVEWDRDRQSFSQPTKEERNASWPHQPAPLSGAVVPVLGAGQAAIHAKGKRIA